jgi:hypothetical protein
MVASTINLITCSYSGDYEVCELLCQSIDKFAPAGTVHRLYVPRRDTDLFAKLARPHRILGTQEDLLPNWLARFPLPNPKWRSRLHLPTRNVYVTPFTPPIRGWIAQQIMKISATLRSEADVIAHVDSDNFFIRPITPAVFNPEPGKVRFYAGTQGLGLSTHKPWYAAAKELLGVDDEDVYTADYIDQFVVWRRAVVEAMTKRIEDVTGRGWDKALVKTPHFSEYVLYGVFAERVLGLDAAGLSKQSQSLSLWTGRRSDSDEEPASAAGLTREHLLCNIQSVLPVTLEERRHAFRHMVARAAEQDA